jgi:hypothetical protein
MLAENVEIAEHLQDFVLSAGMSEIELKMVFRALTILLKGGTTLFSIQLIVIIQTYISWSNISNKNKTTLNSKLNVTTLEYGKQKLLKPSTFS